jgi:hypothetical protein
MSKQMARDSACDCVKGCLVVLMVIYHVMSIMSAAETEDFRYIRFVSGSFIFVTGYIVARFMQPGFSRDPMTVSRRLVIRGVKIFLIFTALNVLIQATGVGNVDKMQLGPDDYWTHAATIYLVGDGRVSSFVILLPIAYLLMVAPVLLRLASYNEKWMPAFMLAIVLVVAALPTLTARSAVIEFMLIGLVGACAGLLSRPFETGSSDSRWRWLAALGALFVSVWIAGNLGNSVATYTLGIALVSKCMYEVAHSGPAIRGLSSSMALLGQYSLLSYIAQIVGIQLLFRLFGKVRWPLGLELGMFCLVTVVTLILFCMLLNHLRARSTAVDKVYRLVFA